MRNDPWWAKSVGHITFQAEREYINIKGEVYVANRGAALDPEGIRYGAITDCYTRSVTPEQLMKDIQEFLGQMPQYKAYTETGYKFLSPRAIS